MIPKLLSWDINILSQQYNFVTFYLFYQLTILFSNNKAKQKEKNTKREMSGTVTKIRMN